MTDDWFTSADDAVRNEDNKATYNENSERILNSRFFWTLLGKPVIWLRYDINEPVARFLYISTPESISALSLLILEGTLDAWLVIYERIGFISNHDNYRCSRHLETLCTQQQQPQLLR